MVDEEARTLETSLAANHVAYLNAVASGDDETQHRALAVTCSTVARLLGRLLEEESAWDKYGWIDDVIPESVSLAGENAMCVTGHAILDVGGGKTCVEPLTADLRFTTVDGSFVSATIKFADRNMALGSMPYEVQLGRRGRSLPTMWRFNLAWKRCGDP